MRALVCDVYMRYRIYDTDCFYYSADISDTYMHQVTIIFFFLSFFFPSLPRRPNGQSVWWLQRQNGLVQHCELLRGSGIMGERSAAVPRPSTSRWHRYVLIVCLRTTRVQVIHGLCVFVCVRAYACECACVLGPAQNIAPFSAYTCLSQNVVLTHAHICPLFTCSWWFSFVRVTFLMVFFFPCMKKSVRGACGAASVDS